MAATKHHGLLLAGAAVFLILAVSAFGLSLRYAWALRDLQNLQAKAAIANYQRNIIQTLANEASDYGRRNPRIVPILEAADARQKAQKNAAAPPPAGLGQAPQP